MRIFKRESTDTTTWGYDIRHDNLPNRRERKSGFRTRNEAKLRAIQRLKELDSEDIDLSQKIAWQYIESWVAVNKLPNISESGAKQFKTAINVFKLFFKNTRLKDVKHSDYQRMINEYGKDKAYKTVYTLNNRLKEVFNSAYQDELIRINPAWNIKITFSKDAQSIDSKYIGSESYVRLLQFLKLQKDIRYLPVFIIAITGSRLNESLQLRFDDIKYMDRIHLPGTKTQNAKRTVAISTKDMQHIKSVLKEYPTHINMKLFNFSESMVRRYLKKALKGIGLEEKAITPRGLRHTHLSYLAMQGLSDEYISKRAGHSNVLITRRIYIHLLEEQKKADEQKLRDLF